MKRWTKRDIRTLESQIDHFVIFKSQYYNADRIVAFIEGEGRRETIVVVGLKGFEAIIRERALKNQEASDHFRDHPEIYGSSTPEMIDRFAKLAEKDSRTCVRLDSLVERVDTDGLPDAILGYLPESLR